MPKEIDAITKLYDYLLWMIPKLERFPRSQKFLLADRIVFAKPAIILTADTRRQSADKKTLFTRATLSVALEKRYARAKASFLSGRRADRFAQRLLFFTSAGLFRAQSRGSRRQKFYVRPRLSSEQSERAVH